MHLNSRNSKAKYIVTSPAIKDCFSEQDLEECTHIDISDSEVDETFEQQLMTNDEIKLVQNKVLLGLTCSRRVQCFDLVRAVTHTEDSPRDKSSLVELFREKIYLQEKRIQKFGLESNNTYTNIRIEQEILKRLLKDCHTATTQQVSDDSNNKLSLKFFKNQRDPESLALKWKMDLNKSRGTLEIPGLLSIQHLSDFELLEDYLPSSFVLNKKPTKKKMMFNRDGYFGEQYKLDLMKMPILSNKFKEVDFGEHFLEQDSRAYKGKSNRPGNRSDRQNCRDKSSMSKSKKNEGQLIPTARMTHYGKKRLKISADQCFSKFSEIERKISDKRQKVLCKVANLKPDDLEDYKTKCLNKCWRGVCGAVVKIQKFFQKDNEHNARKLGALCSKERRRMAVKNRRNIKDYVLRAKRLSKEVTGYWKKRGKELNDLRKKRLKIEQELKKKDEERRDQIKQKKKIEYLIKQSDIYVHIMAQKLGMKKQKNQTEEGVLSKEEELKAQQKVHKVIQLNNERVRKHQHAIDGTIPPSIYILF